MTYITSFVLLHIYIYYSCTSYPYTYRFSPARAKVLQKYLLLLRFLSTRQKVLLGFACAGSSPNVTFSNTSAPAFHLRLQKPMNSDHRFLHFSESHWEPHFSYGFDMTPSCYNTCGLTNFRKLHHIQFHYIFSMFFDSFMLALFTIAS